MLLWQRKEQHWPIITRRNDRKPASSAGKLGEQITIAFPCDWLKKWRETFSANHQSSQCEGAEIRRSYLRQLKKVVRLFIYLFLFWFLYSKRSTLRPPSIEWKTFSSVLDQRNRRSRTTMEIYLNQLAWQRIGIVADIKSLLCNSGV